MKKTFAAQLAVVISLAMAFNLFATGRTYGQSSSPQKIIRLKFQQNDNGKTIYIDTTMTVDGNYDEKQFLQSHGFNTNNLPDIQAGKCKKVITIDEIGMDNDSMQVKYLNGGDSLVQKIIEVNIDTILNKDSKADIIILKGGCNGTPQEEEYEFKQVSPDGKQVEIKRIKVIISAIDKADEEKIGPITSVNPQPELSVSDLSFFPNPGNGRFTLKFSLPGADETAIRIMDVIGRMVFEEKLPNFPGSYEKAIDLSEKGRGTYFIKITQGNRSIVKKAVVME